MADLTVDISNVRFFNLLLIPDKPFALSTAFRVDNWNILVWGRYDI